MENTNKHRDITASDPQGQSLIAALKDCKPQTILDIGASTGRGTTTIMRETCPDAEIFAIELAQDRFDDLKELFAKDSKTHVFRGSTCPPEHLMTLDELKSYQQRFPHWNCWKVADMYGWHENHPHLIKSLRSKYARDIIPHIKKKHKIDTFDFVMVDGSPFTAKYEVEQIHGAKMIFLDDVNDVKNQLNYARLGAGGQYWCVDLNKHHRNGFAVFRNLSS